jgi:predicted nucleotidyltransferase
VTTSGFTRDELRAFLQTMCTLLDEHAQPYALIGGAAVMHHGRRARTRDIDFVVVGDTAALSSAASAAALIVERKSTSHLRLWTQDRAHYADILDADVPFLDAAVRAALRVELAGVSVPIVSAEVLVALKIIAGRPRDLRDVEDILENQPGLSRAHVDAILQPFGLRLSGV